MVVLGFLPVILAISWMAVSAHELACVQKKMSDVGNCFSYMVRYVLIAADIVKSRTGVQIHTISYSDGFLVIFWIVVCFLRAASLPAMIYHTNHALFFVSIISSPSAPRISTMESASFLVIPVLE